jgi:energy-coupling factor transport system substrate-specific component
VGLCALGAVWGFVFGWSMNVWFLSSFGPELSPTALVAAGVASLWFDAAHAAGNVVFALVIGMPMIRLLERYSTRIRVEYAPVPASGITPP